MADTDKVEPTTEEDVTVDTGTEESVDTSTEEDWDSDDIFDDVELDPEDTEEESTEETEESEPEEDVAEETQEEESQEQPEQEEEDTTSEEQPEEKSEDKSDDKTQQEIAHEAFKRREAERRLREEQQSREDERLQNYLKDAEDDDNELAARQQEVRAYQLQKQQVELNQRSLDIGIRQAVADLGLNKMDEATKNYIARSLDKFEAMSVVKDKAGNPLEVKGDVYQYLKEEMDTIKSFRDIGAREQTKRKASEKKRTVAKPTRTPKEAKVDPDLEGFDEEADRW